MSDGSQVTTLFDMAYINPQNLGASTPGETPFLYIDLSAVRKGRIDWGTVTPMRFAEAPSRARRVTRGGDVLFGTVRPALESHGAIPDDALDGEYIASTGFAVLRARPGLSDPRFLYHYCFSESVRNDARRAEVGSNYPAVNESDIKRFRFPHFSVGEQRRIAEILDTLDVQILTTEQLIRKAERSRDGLIIKLLSEGLDRFRPTFDRRGAETHRAGTVVGPIPRDWRVASLATFQRQDRPYLKTGPFGSSLKQEHWVDDGIPVVTIGSLGEGTFLESELLHIAPRTAARLSSYALDVGDIVFSRVADVGRCVVVGDEQKGWIMSSNMMWISLDGSRVDPRFVRANIAINPRIRQQIRRFVNSAGRDVANAAIMNLLKFPWPSLDEQVAIADQIQAWDTEIEYEQSQLAKRRRLAQGLAGDLLSGRARVTMERAR